MNVVGTAARTAPESSASTSAAFTRDPLMMVSICGDRPKVSNTARCAELDRATQSTPAKVKHGRVVGPDTGTPQRSSAATGLPHAPVPCASVFRR